MPLKMNSRPEKENSGNNNLTFAQLQNELYIPNDFYVIDKDSLMKSLEIGIDLTQFKKNRGSLQGQKDGNYMVPGFYYLENGSILLSQGIISKKNGTIN